jgi:flavin-dependent dehydrogenase
MLDVIVVGAGPAGSTAALILARAGLRVRLIDRATFPRDKLCGDTVNPGTLAALRRLGVAGEVDDRGLRIDGMLVTGTNGVAIEGRYPRGLHGRSIVRRDLDWTLVQHAVAAGVQFEPALTVRRCVLEGMAAALGRRRLLRRRRRTLDARGDARAPGRIHRRGASAGRARECVSRAPLDRRRPGPA